MTQSIDRSRYIIARFIADRYIAGESIEDLGRDYFDGDTNPPYIVELIVAAADREGRYEVSMLSELPVWDDAMG